MEIRYQQSLEANSSSSHAVAQLVLVSKEWHGAHICLDGDWLIEDRYAISFSRYWISGVSFFCRRLQMLPEFIKLWMTKSRIF